MPPKPLRKPKKPNELIKVVIRRLELFSRRCERVGRRYPLIAGDMLELEYDARELRDNLHYIRRKRLYVI